MGFNPVKALGETLGSIPIVGDISRGLGITPTQEDPSIQEGADAQRAEMDQFYAALRMREENALGSTRTQFAFGGALGTPGTGLEALTIGGTNMAQGTPRVADDTTLSPLAIPTETTTATMGNGLSAVVSGGGTAAPRTPEQTSASIQASLGRNRNRMNRSWGA